MNRAKDSPNVSISSSNGITRISTTGTSLMNENGQIVYRRSPVPQQSATSQQPQSFDTLGSPSNTSFNSEEISEAINSSEEDNINELTLRFDQLQRQIEELTANQSTQDERYKRSRQENEALLNRVHGLEDQLRELELSSEVRTKEEEKRFKETMAKQMKIQSQECEQHLHANFLLQQDIFKLKNDLLKGETLIKALRSEKESLESELQEKNSELTSLDEEIHKLKLQVKNLKDEENVKTGIINLLTKELEDSPIRSQQRQQPFNNSYNNFINSNDENNDHNTSVASSSQFFNHSSPKHRSTSSRRSSITSGFGEALRDIDGLETNVNKLREENKKLRETNEELQAELLNFQLEEGRSLVQEGNKSYSLADEMGDIDVQRLMKALKEQQDDNARLRKYMDEILLKIVEKNPEILDKTVASDKNHNDLTTKS